MGLLDYVQPIIEKAITNNLCQPVYTP